jgi:energy-coupling factor transporter ATP-binding protein EcfA2
MQSDEEEEGVQELVAEPPHTTILLIGRSGSGKSTLCRYLLKRFAKYNKPICIVNDRAKTSKYRQVSWGDLATLAGVALVVEDVIGADNTVFKTLQNVLNYKAHHDKVSPVLVISHSLEKQNLIGLLSSFTHIYVTANKSNVPSFRRLLTIYCYSESEKQAYLTKFLQVTDKFQHFCLDVDKMTIELESFRMDELDDDQLPNKKAAPKAVIASANAARYLAVDKKEVEKKIALFELLYPGLPPKQFNHKNLTLKVKNNAKEEMVVSIIDYLTAMVDESAVPDPLLLQLHQYLKKTRGVALPRSFVLNKAFW